MILRKSYQEDSFYKGRPLSKSLALSVLAVSLIGTCGYAGTIREKSIIQVFKNTDCAKNNSCDLKEFSIETNNYHVMFNPTEISHGTNIYMNYKTDKVENLQKYGIVQKIRGCKFESRLESDGSVTKEVAGVRDFFGQSVKFKHADWSIDSTDLDPFYNSMADVRHGAYRWNTKPGSYDGKTQKYVIDSGLPPTPMLYISDLPGTAFAYNDESAKNISLEFEVCIYKTADIPLTLEKPTDVNFAKPIACHSWKSSFIYDYAKKKFEVKKDIDAFCLEKSEEKKEVGPLESAPEMTSVVNQ